MNESEESQQVINNLVTAIYLEVKTMILNLPTYNLVIISSLKVKKLSDSKITITKKFLDGITAYQKYFSGSITVIMESTNDKTTNLDDIIVNII
ncbi:hypothetical protein [Geminocystis sp. GBBB08]|uniref:hypothetical protein n=1 Tax=Geminocystis sp. GBBB08 TaxID=2604140 RepID=UPI0027E2F3AD|nr:hypothetical protein [Geminocystis sp. GBBB08]MBL1208995.1 hypothetical protein [Geminocystis sp. GBBB08]